MSEDDAVSMTVPEFVDRLFRLHVDTHAAHDKAHEREHQDQMTALNKAEDASKEWRSAANEWREAMKDREARFALRSELTTEPATRNDLVDLVRRLGDLEDVNIKRATEEANRATTDAEKKADDQRRESSERWRIGIVVTIIAVGATIIVNIVLNALS